MTTDNDNAAAIWAGLSKGERETLQALKSGANIHVHMSKLFEFKLAESVTSYFGSEEVYRDRTRITPLGRAVLAVSTQAPVVGAAGATDDHQTPVDTRPTSMSARGIVANLEVWEKRKDSGQCNLIWKGDHIDGIGQVTPDVYMIEYGGQVNYPDMVTGDTQIEIEWLPQAATSPAAAAGGDEEAQTFAKLCEREIVKIRDMVLKDDQYTGDLLGDAVGSPVGVTLCVEARMQQIAHLTKENERLIALNARLARQIAKLKRTASLDEGFIDFLTEKGDNHD